MNPVKFIDLFAGIGGFRCALETVGMPCVWSNEFNKHAAAVYKDNFGDVNTQDIRTIAAKAIPNHDLICGGFPCQPFSVHGKRNLDDDPRGQLYKEILRIAEHSRAIMFLENVEGLTIWNSSEVFEKILREIRSLGYRVYWKLIDSINWLPTFRKRVYIVAFPQELPAGFNWPVIPIHRESQWHNIRENLSLDEWHDWQISNPMWLRYEKYKRLETAKQLDSNFTARSNTFIDYCDNYAVFNTLVSMSSMTHPTIKRAGYPRRRHLTGREFARLLGFPEWFNPPLNKSHVQKLFGNSIAVPVVRDIGRQILLALHCNNSDEEYTPYQEVLI